MKKIIETFEKYPAEDIDNLLTYAWIGMLMILVAEVWKCLIG